MSQSLDSSNHYRQGKFHNSTPKEAPSFSKMMEIFKRYIVEERIDSRPAKALPIKLVSRAQLDALSNRELHVIKLGHSSILLKIYGEYWLIDPVFSERASPFSFIGPKRFQSTPISIAELPTIKSVLISHNHYDHLDKTSIQQLADKTEQFLVPLGNQKDMQKWGVAKAQIKSFDWWQEYKVGETVVAFTPSQHFSGRSMSDRNRTLWGSWVIKTAKQSLFFSGDSGYFKGFKEIGEKYGPFDLTMIEVGAYNKDWPKVHMMPEQSVQAHIDLRGETMLAIHNSTFDLAFHSWYEPLERAALSAQRRKVNLITPIVGEVFTSTQNTTTNQWWKTQSRQ